MPDSTRWTNGGDPSLNEINRADRFFEALAAKQPAYPTDHAEAELALLFAELRDDVRDAPLRANVSLGDAVEALQGGMARGKASRRSLAVVGSVAAAMLCIGGFGTAVYGAAPGDSLYGMRTALFGQHEETRDDQVSLASAQLQQVQQLIDDGQWEEAQSKLAAVSTTVQDVGPVEQKQQLVEQWNALTYKVVEQDPAATLAPGAPLPALPSSPLTWLPVPAVEATPSSDTATTDTSATSPTTSTSASPSTSTSAPDTTVTSPSDSAVPPGSTTPPSGVSSTPSASTPSSAPSSASTPSSTASSSVASSSAAPTSATTTATSSAAQPAPSSTSTAPASATGPSSAASTPSTTTTVTRQPVVSQPSSPPAVASTPAEAPVQPSSAISSAVPAAPTTTTTVIPPG